MINYQIEEGQEGLIFTFNRLLDGQKQEIKIGKRADHTVWPIIFYTATNDIRDFIANVITIGSDKCSVDGIYRGSKCILGARMLDIQIKPNDRVMITEHINVDGKMELIATKKRILYLEDSSLNFINVGFSNDKGSIYKRIDIYTAETKDMAGGPIGKK